MGFFYLIIDAIEMLDVTETVEDNVEELKAGNKKSVLELE